MLKHFSIRYFSLHSNRRDGTWMTFLSSTSASAGYMRLVMDLRRAWFLSFSFVDKFNMDPFLRKFLDFLVFVLHSY